MDDGAFVFDDPAGRLTGRKRLERLRNTGLLQLRQLPGLDSLTRLAAHATDSPVAVVALVESVREVFPSYFGPESPVVESREMPISDSLDQYVVINDAPLVLGDARTHPVLHDHPAVQLGLVAYAGYPLHDPEGVVLGALCVVDLVPREWTAQDLLMLGDLASAVETMIALRLSRRQTHVDHERLLHVLNGAANTMILIADADGVVTTMNRTAEELWGQAPSESGDSWTLDELAATAMPRGPELGQDNAQDWLLRQTDGRHRVISVRLSVLSDTAGEVDGYVIVGDDVSVRREAEQVLRDTVQQQAEAVQRLESLDAARTDFIATASHELRTPVTTILGFTELLADGEVGNLTAPQMNVVSRVNRNSHRLLYLVEDLLSLSRIDAAEVALVHTEVGVEALAHRVWDGLRTHLVGRTLKATLDIADDAGSVAGDAVQLERALLNLLTNAVKFTPDGGSVALSVQQGKDAAVFTVTDTGIGIAADEQTAVFEPFFRTQAAQMQAVPGSGVGLAVVRRIVEAHGGQVSLRSAPGKGTEVAITVSVRAEGGPTPSKPPVPPLPART